MGILHFLKKIIGGKKPKSAAQRKLESEGVLAYYNIPFIKHLPRVEEENEVQLRSAKEIAERILILSYLTYIAETSEAKEEIINYFKQYSLWGEVSAVEKALLQKEVLTEQDKINIYWRFEAIRLLLWTINKEENLPMPFDIVNVREIIRHLPGFLKDPNNFIENATLKPATEILDNADLTYRLHWATRDAHLKGLPMPANLNLSVIMERHYAINWVIQGADWDNVDTST